jgi:hypothetical protein
MSIEYAKNEYDMAYELFDSKATRIGPLALTIQGDVRIALNADVGDLLTSRGAKYAQILWDRDSLKIGIRPLQKRDGRAFKLTFYKSKRGASLSAQSFLHYIQWKPGSFATPVHWNEKEALLEAVLPRERVGSAEGKSRKR